MAPSELPTVLEFPLMEGRPLYDQAHRTRGQLAFEDCERGDLDDR